jgi:hypothetical protein
MANGENVHDVELPGKTINAPLSEALGVRVTPESDKAVQDELARVQKAEREAERDALLIKLH